MLSGSLSARLRPVFAVLLTALVLHFLVESTPASGAQPGHTPRIVDVSVRR